MSGCWPTGHIGCHSNKDCCNGYCKWEDSWGSHGMGICKAGRKQETLPQGFVQGFTGTFATLGRAAQSAIHGAETAGRTVAYGTGVGAAVLTGHDANTARRWGRKTKSGAEAAYNFT